MSSGAAATGIKYKCAVCGDEHEAPPEDPAKLPPGVVMAPSEKKGEWVFVCPKKNCRTVAGIMGD